MPNIKIAQTAPVSTMTSQLHETISSTLTTFLNGYVSASAAKDASLVSAVLDPDCIRYLGPQSFLKAVGAPPGFGFSVQDFEHMYATELQFGATNSVEISDVTIDTVAKKASAKTVYANELISGEQHAVEIVWFLNFSEDGTKVAKITQWVDSADFPVYQGKVKALEEGTK